MFALAGCNGAEQQAQAPPPPGPAEVFIATPVVGKVTDYEDFTGRTEAVSTIEVRARVTGYLDKVLFVEGATVKKDDVLAEIDPRPYEAERARAEATHIQSEAHLKRLESDFQRANGLLKRRAIGQEEYEKISGDRAEASAAVGVAVASVQLAQLNLSFTKVKAPIDGRIGRRLVDPGNLVKADETALTTIVTLDPMHASFDVDERTVLRLRRILKDHSAQDTGVRVLMGLSDEDGFPHEGTINFEDNRVDPSTGTLRLRGKFPNPKGLLSPGLFARVRLPVGAPYEALLVSEQALGRDQGQKFVYVVDAKNEIEYRPIKVGRLHNGMRVVTEGLTKDDRVVVNGLQRIRAKAKVEPKGVAMPGAEKKEKEKVASSK